MAANQLDRTSIDIRGLTNAQASVYDSPARSSTNLGLGTAGLVQRFVGTRFTASALPVRQHQERKLVIRYSQVLLTGARRTYSYHGILYSICLCFRLPFDDAKAALSTRLRASTKSEMCEANDSQKALHEGHAVSRESYGLVLRINSDDNGFLCFVALKSPSGLSCAYVLRQPGAQIVPWHRFLGF